MKPSSSTSDSSPGADPADPAHPAGGLLAPLFTDADVEVALGDAALFAAMLTVEAALAEAEAEVGLVPVEAADAIGSTARALGADPSRIAAIGRDAMAAGNPVNPMVRALTAAVPEAARPFVHLGTTSQDVLDSALMLLARTVGERVVTRLDAVADALVGLGERSGEAVLPARTLGQQAVPTTFGLKVAGWLVAVDDVRDRLAAVLDTRLAVQFGGAAGTLSGLDGHGPAVLAALARRLGLVEPVLPWHTDRQRLLELGSALAGAVAAAGKIALDLVLLSATELGEAVPGTGGGSTAMPHKANPVDAILVRSAALRTPGLVATLFVTAAQHEHERAAGAWHAEWEPLRQLLSLAGGSSDRLLAAVEGVRVVPERMVADLDVTGGLLMSESVAAALAPALGRDAAHRLVRACTQRAVESGATLADVLGQDPQVREHLGTEALAAALDPQAGVRSASALAERALAQRRSRPPRRGTT